MQETQVQSLVQEDPTYLGATKPVSHSYWARALEPADHNYWALKPQLLKPACPRAGAPQEKLLQWEALAPQLRGNSCSPQIDKSPAQPKINKIINKINSVQFSSVTQSCPTLCDPMDCSMPGLPVYRQLPELMQTHVHWVSDAIQPSHPLSSPSPPALNLSQHQGLFQWVRSSPQVEFPLQHQSFQWIFRTDFL